MSLLLALEASYLADVLLPEGFETIVSSIVMSFDTSMSSVTVKAMTMVSISSVKVVSITIMMVIVDMLAGLVNIATLMRMVWFLV